MARVAICHFPLTFPRLLLLSWRRGGVSKWRNTAIGRFPQKSGSADVLEALGINLYHTPEELADIFDKTGLVFLFAQHVHPNMRYVMPVRRELEVRINGAQSHWSFHKPSQSRYPAARDLSSRPFNNDGRSSEIIGTPSRSSHQRAKQ